MLKILMGPNVKILMGQSFGSWTHGHGPMALVNKLDGVPEERKHAAEWEPKYFKCALSME